jgi:predicted Fe-S protein YdhL (DUF1289 family)
MRSAATYIPDPVRASPEPIRAPVPFGATWKRWSMQSPCIRVCLIDPATGLCAGCRRSLDEIARWTQMTDAERQRVVSCLAVRRPPRPDTGR